jgi:hypothetical protein
MSRAFCALLPLLAGVVASPGARAEDYSPLAACPAGNLLAGRRPTSWQDTRRDLALLTDEAVAPEGAACAACHANHHRPDANCVACHAGANPIAVHKPSDHLNCASASCHGARAANLPATREMCLMCHTNQTNHAPGKVCENCHAVTARGTR